MGSDERFGENRTSWWLEPPRKPSGVDLHPPAVRGAQLWSWGQMNISAPIGCRLSSPENYPADLQLVSRKRVKPGSDERFAALVALVDGYSKSYSDRPIQHRWTEKGFFQTAESSKGSFRSPLVVLVVLELFLVFLGWAALPPRETHPGLPKASGLLWTRRKRPSHSPKKSVCCTRTFCSFYVWSRILFLLVCLRFLFLLY